MSELSACCDLIGKKDPLGFRDCLAAAAITGRVKINWVPFPTSDSTEMLPPRASARFLHIVSPKPTPC